MGDRCTVMERLPDGREEIVATCTTLGEAMSLIHSGAWACWIVRSEDD